MLRERRFDVGLLIGKKISVKFLLSSTGFSIVRMSQTRMFKDRVVSISETGIMSYFIHSTVDNKRVEKTIYLFCTNTYFYARIKDEAYLHKYNNLLCAYLHNHYCVLLPICLTVKPRLLQHFSSKKKKHSITNFNHKQNKNQLLKIRISPL